MRERSRRKPVDEEDTKLGRWVSLAEYSKFAVLWIYMYYEILFFLDILLHNLPHFSFILLHMYSTLCFGKSSATFIMLSNFAPVIELSFTRSGRFLFSLPLFLLLSFDRSRSYYFILSIWLETGIRPVLPAQFCEHLSSRLSRWTERTMVDAMTVVESRY